MSVLNELIFLNVGLMLFSSAVTFFLLLGMCLTDMPKLKFLRPFIALLVAHMFMQLGEAGIWAFNGSPKQALVLKSFCFLSYLAANFVMWLFTKCLTSFLNQYHRVSLLPERFITLICIVLQAGAILSLQWDVFFTVNPQGVYIDGEFAAVDAILSFIGFFINLSMVMYYRKLMGRKVFLLILSYCLLPLVTVLIHDIWYPVPIYLIMTLLLLMIFIHFYGALERKLALKDKELVESKIAVMTSQIQPHFLYNSLNTIYHLCALDAKLAQNAVSDFSDYLRGVLGSLQRTEPITFAEELHNVQAYLALEKLRFDDDLQIIYDIQATNFLVPALSVQMLAENAVKHGLCVKENGGTLFLTTRERENCFEITVQDDGIGFAFEQIAQDGRLHLGIENARLRLASMVNGTLKIASIPHVGTTVLISIPKEANNGHLSCR